MRRKMRFSSIRKPDSASDDHMSVQDMKARFRAAPDRVTVSVHRGLWDPLPENSLAAIRKASAWDVVEVDVRLDERGHPYLMHDASLARTTGACAESDGAEADLLRALRLKEGAGGDGIAMTDQPVPTIEAAFDAIEGSDAVFDLDVKRDEDVEAVAAHVANLGAQGRATVKIDVPTEREITRLQALEDKYDIMVMAKLSLATDEDVAVLEVLRAADVAMVEVSFASLDLLARACAIGEDAVRVGVFTLDGIHCCGMSDARALENPDDVWGRLIDAGVRQIMTDRPHAVSTYLSSR